MLKKTHEKSRFVYDKATEIKNYEGVVLQVEQCRRIDTSCCQMAIFELVSTKDYERTTLEGELAAVRKELETTKANAAAYLQGLECGRRQAEELRGENARQLENVRTLFQIINEIRRVYNGIPEDIETRLKELGGSYSYLEGRTTHGNTKTV